MKQLKKEVRLVTGQRIQRQKMNGLVRFRLGMRMVYGVVLRGQEVLIGWRANANCRNDMYGSVHGEASAGNACRGKSCIDWETR